MLLKIYTVYDMKTEAYMKPFFCLTNGEAVRTFGDAANDPSSAFYRHPEDYVLYCIGTFDDIVNVVESAPPENLGTAMQYRDMGNGHA